MSNAIAASSRSDSNVQPPRPRFAQGKEKAIAACAGALVTSLTMNPFDVIKTRLQTQGITEPLFMPSKYVPPPAATFRTDASTSKTPLPRSISATNQATCCQITYFTPNKYQDSLLCKFDPRTSAFTLPAAGGHVNRISSRPFSQSAMQQSSTLIASASAACTYPTSSVAATDLPRRATPSARHFTGFFDALVKIVKYEGAGTLWRGVGPSMAISVPSQATYMVGYDYLRRFFLDHPIPLLVSQNGEASEFHKIGAPLVAGSLVRGGIVTLFSPIELVRTRLQSLPSTSSFRQVTSSTWAVVRSQGLSSLWRGLPATLWRDVPFSGIYWATYEVVQRSLTGTGFSESASTSTAATKQTFAVAFFGGAVSGCVAATITNPFDVIKTRRQASAAASQKSSFRLLYEIASREGMAGLTSGLSPRLAKVALACGLMISFYEVVCSRLDDVSLFSMEADKYNRVYDGAPRW